MFDIFSCSNWTSNLPVRDGYGEYLAYPKSGALTEEQFDQFQKITQHAIETYPEFIDKILATSARFFKSIENTLGIKGPQIPLSARNYWMRYQLYQSNCPVKVFFLPRTFYDILTTHVIEENNDWQKALETPSSSRPYGLVDEHIIDADLFSRVSKELAFSVNQYVLRELQLRQQRPFLTLDEIDSWASSSFRKSPWYTCSWGWKFILDKLDPDMEKFPHLLKKTLALECSAHPSSTILYRGSNFRQDGTEKTDSLKANRGHSLSYGTSLVAGGKKEHVIQSGATPWIYCLQENIDCFALKVLKGENHPFFIPRTELQMLSSGEFFHARSKIPPGEIQNVLLTPDEVSFLKNYKHFEFLKFSGSSKELADLWRSFQEKAVLLTPP